MAYPVFWFGYLRIGTDSYGIDAQSIFIWIVFLLYVVVIVVIMTQIIPSEVMRKQGGILQMKSIAIFILLLNDDTTIVYISECQALFDRQKIVQTVLNLENMQMDIGLLILSYLYCV